MALPRFSYFLIPLLAIFIAFIFFPGYKDPTASGMTIPPLDSPCPLVHTPQYETKKNDTFTKGATHMALVHNAILRGFNSIYQQAPHVKEADYPDFVGYSLAWYNFVKLHHDDEETELFPKVEEIIGKKGIWGQTHKEHEAFLAGLGEYESYLKGLKTPKDFDGAKLVSIMDTFQKPFNDHFHSEIKTIAALSELGDYSEAGPVFAKWGKTSLMKSGYADGIPMLFFNFDRTFEDGMWAAWPPMPAPIRVLLTKVGSTWHWGWWKFASCDGDGNPKALYAAVPSTK